MHSLFLFALVAGATLAMIVAAGSLAGREDGANPAAAPAANGEGDLPAPALASISHSLGRADRALHARSSGGAVSIANPRHGLTARFSSQGAELRVGTLGFGIALQAVGRGPRLQPAGAGAPRADRNRVVYTRAGGVEEWYVNGPVGLEHGFTVMQRPAGGTAPLLLSVDLDRVRARVVDGGRSATLVGPGGEAVSGYRDLWARDAEGRSLRAWLEPTAAGLAVRVDDREARYPLVIDPFIEAAN